MNAFSPRSPNDCPADGLSTPDGAKGDPEAYNVGDTIREPSPQIRGNELPVCGNCEGALSFPFCHHPALSDSYATHAITTAPLT